MMFSPADPYPPKFGAVLSKHHALLKPSNPPEYSDPYRLPHSSLGTTETPKQNMSLLALWPTGEIVF
jgi:hypothetical protein